MISKSAWHICNLCAMCKVRWRLSLIQFIHADKLTAYSRCSLCKWKHLIGKEFKFTAEQNIIYDKQQGRALQQPALYRFSTRFLATKVQPTWTVTPNTVTKLDSGIDCYCGDSLSRHSHEGEVNLLHLLNRPEWCGSGVWIRRGVSKKCVAASCDDVLLFMLHITFTNLKV